MSIQSTRTITRETAIFRINEIKSLVAEQDYKGIEATTFEPDYNICDFVNRGAELCNLSKWTDRMPEDQIDAPFYRFSMFDNYRIGDTAD